MKNTRIFAMLIVSAIMLMTVATGCDGCNKPKPKPYQEFAGVELKLLPTETLVVTRNYDTMENLAKNFSILFQWLVMTQTEIHGPNTAIFFDLHLDIERDNDIKKIIYFTGIPVAKGTNASKPVKVYTFDACTAACIMHRGAYTSINNSYKTLMKWILNNGYEPTGLYRENFIAGPGPNDPGDLMKWITEIQIPVKKIN